MPTRICALLFLVSLALPTHAAIVITPVVVIDDGLPDDATSNVTVTLHGYSDSGAVQPISSYGITASVLLDGVAPPAGDLGSRSINAAVFGSDWFDFSQKPTDFGAGGTTAEFQGYYFDSGLGVVQMNSDIGPTAIGDALGSFSFTVPKLVGATQALTINLAESTAVFPPAAPSGSGFFEMNAGLNFDKVASNLVTGSGTIGSQAVPEPSSLFAAALGLGGLAFRRRRNAA